MNSAPLPFVRRTPTDSRHQALSSIAVGVRSAIKNKQKKIYYTTLQELHPPYLYFSLFFFVFIPFVFMFNLVFFSNSYYLVRFFPVPSPRTLNSLCRHLFQSFCYSSPLLCVLHKQKRTRHTTMSDQ